MRLASLFTLLILACCTAPPTANQDEIVLTENSVEATPPEAAPAPDANAVVLADNDPGQTGGTLHICDFGGWSADRDPKGLNVRAGPSATAKIVRTLPPPDRLQGALGAADRIGAGRARAHRLDARHLRNPGNHLRWRIA